MAFQVIDGSEPLLPESTLGMGGIKSLSGQKLRMHAHAKDFLLDMSDAGSQVHFKAMRKLHAEHPSEKVGKEIRKLYSWNNDDEKLINN